MHLYSISKKALLLNQSVIKLIEFTCYCSAYLISWQNKKTIFDYISNVKLYGYFWFVTD